ncbi:periplasmic chaperone for outer membrane proteins Skp [Kordia periserrulae]|uniref:Periplasmic chaperone for outer membrane proteins Skp n=1 Tax=Kordia periserrulae TaxID=701523 RepID=A0A2T6C3V5_9FLAO|nr:OmpH family outer membrane protein [Kordia periserrulae]PTX63010.1 periplasmic chaperone for outer membrane proteins Skp [Kordia periserrulae]
MKIKHLLYTFAIVFCSYTVSAQTKVGTVNINILVSKLPEIAEVQKGMEAYEKELQADLKAKLDAYGKEVEAANAAFKDMTDEDKKKKQKEIFDLENDIQKFRQNAVQLVQLKQDELMRPLYKKVGDAVAAVSKEEKYTQVFTLDGNELAYIDPQYDITLKTAAKLGLKLDEEK